MAHQTVRMLVVSDLHAFDGVDDDSAPSIMQFSGGSGRGEELLQSCAEIVRARFQDIDLILVAGDITNHAEPIALEQTWSHLHKVSEKLNAPIVATAGNHDYDSRGKTGRDPRGALINLSPRFPIDDEAARQHYFAYDYAVLREPDFIVVTLNSAAQHGYSFGDRHEYEHGRVLQRTIKHIDANLREGGALPHIKVLLVHHHVAQLPDLDTEEQSILTDAQPLLRMLADHGEWLVVHGHKHRPWMQYAAGGGDAPAVFSAGSFSANFGVGRFAAAVRKQFYVVEIVKSSEPLPEGVTFGGYVHAWTYDGFEWAEAGGNDGYPGVSGFGWRTSTSTLASRLHQLVTEERTLDSARIAQFEPRMPFLSPDDRQRVLTQLRCQSPPVSASTDSRGAITELYVREDAGEK